MGGKWFRKQQDVLAAGARIAGDQEVAKPPDSPKNLKNDGEVVVQCIDAIGRTLTYHRGRDGATSIEPKWDLIEGATVRRLGLAAALVIAILVLAGLAGSSVLRNTLSPPQTAMPPQFSMVDTRFDTCAALATLVTSGGRLAGVFINKGGAGSGVVRLWIDGQAETDGCLTAIPRVEYGDFAEVSCWILLSDNHTVQVTEKPHADSSAPK